MTYVDFRDFSRKMRKKVKKSSGPKLLIINSLLKMAKKSEKKTKIGVYTAQKMCYNVFIQNQVRHL